MTDEPLDVALDGDGFFSVATANGVRYTRDGQFRVDASGKLVTAVGDAVLGTNGRPVVVGAGAKPDDRDRRHGEAGGKAIGKLAVAALTNPTKVDGGFFTGGAAGPAKDTAVRQGFLEQPNATAAETMVDMIESLRAFEADQRVIHAIDESLQRGIQAGGRRRGLKSDDRRPMTRQTHEQGRAGLHRQGPHRKTPIAIFHPLPTGKGA